MKFDEFLGHVQHRARLASSGEALRATQAVLEVLAQRLAGGEAEDLAAQLPSEFKDYLRQPNHGESFGLDEFFERVQAREGVDLPESVHHVRAVISVLKDAVSAGEIADVRAQLPSEYDPLFEAGSEGRMTQAA